MTSPPSSATVPAPGPGDHVVKSAPSAEVHAAGDVISYGFAVTNTGNVTLTGGDGDRHGGGAGEPANLVR